MTSNKYLRLKTIYGCGSDNPVALINGCATNPWPLLAIT